MEDGKLIMHFSVGRVKQRTYLRSSYGFPLSLVVYSSEGGGENLGKTRFAYKDLIECEIYNSGEATYP